MIWKATAQAAATESSEPATTQMLATIRSLQTECDSAIHQLAETTKSRDHLQSQIGAMESSDAEMSDLRDRLLNSETETALLVSKLQTAHAEVDTLTVQIEDLHASKSVLEAERDQMITALRNELDQVHLEQESTRFALLTEKDQNAKANELIKDLKKEGQKNLSRISNLESEHAFEPEDESFTDSEPSQSSDLLDQVTELQQIVAEARAADNRSQETIESLQVGVACIV